MRFVVSSDVAARDVGAELVILDMKSGSYFGLEGAGVRIWRLIEAGRSLREIADVVTQEYEVDPADAARDAADLAADLLARRLIAAADDA